jgi:hypothetical protein
MINVMSQPEPDGPKNGHRLRWQVVLGSVVVVIGLIGAALAGTWNQNRTLDQRVEHNLDRSNRIETAVDSVRVPVCAILYAGLSRLPQGLTPQQLEARQVYGRYYGPGTHESPGLNCPLALPTIPAPALTSASPQPLPPTANRDAPR